MLPRQINVAGILPQRCTDVPILNAAAETRPASCPADRSPPNIASEQVNRFPNSDLPMASVLKDHGMTNTSRELAVDGE